MSEYAILMIIRLTYVELASLFSLDDVGMEGHCLKYKRESKCSPFLVVGAAGL